MPNDWLLVLNNSWAIMFVCLKTATWRILARSRPRS